MNPYFFTRKFRPALCAAAALAAASCKTQEPAPAPLTADLEQASRSWHMTSFQPAGATIKIGNRYHNMVFHTNSRQFVYEGTSVWMSYPVILKNRRWHIAESDSRKTVVPILMPLDFLKKNDVRTVVLDAGHGGRDVGAVGRFRRVKESDIALELAKKVRDILPPHFRVRLTRSWDRELGLDERCERANRWNADLFVSIHLNAAAATSAAGVETHILAPLGTPVTGSPSSLYSRDKQKYAGNRHDEANTILGYYLQRGLVKYTGATDRGLRRSRFVVIRDVACPSALVECGFISNPTEEAKVLTEDYQVKLARGIAEGIICFVSMSKRASLAGGR